MINRGGINKLAGFHLVVLILYAISASSNAAEKPQHDIYAQTIAALQQRYQDEVLAELKYNAYALRAEQESYPNIAYLFKALAASEAVHARNFKNLLSGLDVEAISPDISDYFIGSTRENIHHATTVEADEIDKEYPYILKSISTENHKQAIRYINYAWQAEKQHRKLMLKIKRASISFFGLLVSHIEGEPTRYYVCQICGSTLTDLPVLNCPICEHPSSEYQEVPGFPGYPEDEID